VPRVAVKAKVFTYDVEVVRGGRVTAGGEAPLDLDPAWTPEHLLLAGLVRCSLQSLRYHARRAGLDVVGSGSAHAVVTKREDDGRYALVEAECTLEAELDPPPPLDEMRALLAKAERDCFVSASLSIEPGYRWTINGEDVEVG
jgi:organic hydroperoxide reductase OsmC/OhrA